MTDRAVSSIAAIGDRIRQMSVVATSIAAAVEQQGAATQEIVRNIVQAASDTTEVTSNVVGLARASEHSGVASSQVMSASVELSGQAEQLSAEVARFLGDVRAT